MAPLSQVRSLQYPPRLGHPGARLAQIPSSSPVQVIQLFPDADLARRKEAMRASSSPSELKSGVCVRETDGGERVGQVAQPPDCSPGRTPLEESIVGLSDPTSTPCLWLVSP